MPQILSTCFVHSPIPLSLFYENCICVFSDIHDGFITQSVISQNGRRKISTVSCTLEDYKTKSNGIEDLEPTEWAHWMKVTILHFTYSIFFIVIFFNLCFGSLIIIPLLNELYYDYDMDTGYLMDKSICYPDIFWFSFLTLCIEYFVMLVFLIGFFVVAPREISSWNSDSSN